ncbi:ribosome biogenesis protein WDR12 homolog [Homalodisca vitripennis]|uniref:ribosome biogenesis protein WDR12 homolog n=1 Tax=Homalodisca vitripennis TaxID=197043 RepID=UPI001EEB373B|nr:ribosome biogenesis protein WDR12 homolog [Homalodisca vitripennis]
MDDSSNSQLQIRFVTKQEQYAVPDAPFAVQANISTSQLNTLVNELIKESQSAVENAVEFDFIVAGELVRSRLGEHVSERGVSSEGVVTVEYVERLPAPQPSDCLLHDDWVSALHARDKWILTGCYDNTLHLWTMKGKHKLTIPGHTAPIKAVAWVSVTDTLASFVSASHDQTAMLWEWSVAANAVECVHVCRGHERGLECVAVDTEGSRFATGGWDALLKIWSAGIHSASDQEDGESASKRAKRDGSKSQIRTPLLTLKGHREAVSAVCWRGSDSVVTSSWDHTLRSWDLTSGTLTSELCGNKSFFDLHVSPLTGLYLTASADRHVRLYDPRSTEGSVVKSTFTSHSQWVQTVRWSPTDEHLFISGAYDNTVKLWDSRSPKVPLYDLIGHEDKVLCSDWSVAKYMMSGGADNTLRVFKSKQYKS